MKITKHITKVESIPYCVKSDIKRYLDEIDSRVLISCGHKDVVIQYYIGRNEKPHTVMTIDYVNNNTEIRSEDKDLAKRLVKAA